MSIKVAIEFFGSQAKLAKALDVSPMVIYQWKKRGVPAVRAKEIVKATDGKIQLINLRPDLFV